METTNSYFTDENSTKYNANNINIFKTTSINKSKFVEYFGTDGYIDIKDNNGVVIQRIDNNREVDENLISKDLTIETLNPGETSVLEYQISVKEVEGDNQKLTGKISISADDIETKEYNNITNNIERGELKVTVRNQYSEQIKTYIGDLIEYGVNVKNISGKTLNEIIVEIPILDDVLFDSDYVDMDSNEAYEYVGYENNVIRFKIKSLEQGETQTINIALTANNFDIQEKEKNILEYSIAIFDNKQYISNNVTKVIY